MLSSSRLRKPSWPRRVMQICFSEVDPMPIRQRQSSNTKRSNERGGKRPGSARHISREPVTKFYGVQYCLALFEKRPGDIRRVFLCPEVEGRFEHVIRWSKKTGAFIRVVSSEELSDVAGTDHHEGICIEATPLRGLQPSELTRRLSDLQRGVVLILESIENPHNIGAILRTACFFGVSAVIIRSNVSNSLSGAACRISEGAAEHVPFCIIQTFSNLFDVLKSRGFSVAATTPHEARSLYAVKWSDKVAVMFGAEGAGIPVEVMEAADLRVAIPRLGPIESLNVAASVASVLTEVRREAVVKGLIRRAPQPRR